MCSAMMKVRVLCGVLGRFRMWSTISHFGNILDGYEPVPTTPAPGEDPSAVEGVIAGEGGGGSAGGGLGEGIWSEIDLATEEAAAEAELDAASFEAFMDTFYGEASIAELAEGSAAWDSLISAEAASGGIAAFLGALLYAGLEVSAATSPDHADYTKEEFHDYIYNIYKSMGADYANRMADRLANDMYGAGDTGTFRISDIEEAKASLNASKATGEWTINGTEVEFDVSSGMATVSNYGDVPEGMTIVGATAAGEYVIRVPNGTTLKHTGVQFGLGSYTMYQVVGSGATRLITGQGSAPRSGVLRFDGFVDMDLGWKEDPQWGGTLYVVDDSGSVDYNTEVGTDPGGLPGPEEPTGPENPDEPKVPVKPDVPDVPVDPDDPANPEDTTTIGGAFIGALYAGESVSETLGDDFFVDLINATFADQQNQESEDTDMEQDSKVAADGKPLQVRQQGTRQDGRARLGVRTESGDMRWYEGPVHPTASSVVFGNWCGPVPFGDRMPTEVNNANRRGLSRASLHKAQERNLSALDTYMMLYHIEIHERGDREDAMAAADCVKRIQAAINRGGISREIDPDEAAAAAYIIVKLRQHGHSFFLNKSEINTIDAEFEIKMATGAVMEPVRKQMRLENQADIHQTVSLPMAAQKAINQTFSRHGGSSLASQFIREQGMIQRKYQNEEQRYKSNCVADLAAVSHLLTSMGMQNTPEYHRIATALQASKTGHSTATAVLNQVMGIAQEHSRSSIGGLKGAGNKLMPPVNTTSEEDSSTTMDAMAQQAGRAATARQQMTGQAFEQIMRNLIDVV